MLKGKVVKQTIADHRRFLPSRRGVTLVEMLVTVAMLVLMMTVLVQIFQAATGALSSAQNYQDLDNSLRRLEATIRSDLNGVTARLTPPLNPKDGLGYFEYGENAFADLQGEDSDDYIRFTAKAPEGQPFKGRALMRPPAGTLSAAQLLQYQNTQPITITSDYAEIIYFLRNGNLYRRVLLIAPERQESIVQMVGNAPAFAPGALGGVVSSSWQGVNDLSARPAKSGSSRIVLNSLGDLTNRENRFASPRFSNDYVLNVDGTAGADDFADDTNEDGVPDFYPTLYTDADGAFTLALQNLIYAPGYLMPTGGNFSSMPFPYIFPGAYTQPETDLAQLGWIHSPTPDQTTAPFSTDPLTYLHRLNHNPLDLGDNLYRPDAGDLTTQTWWGFPTSRETLSVNWADPTWQPNQHGGLQASGLNPRDPANAVGGVLKVNDDAELLPAMSAAARSNPQPFNDEWGTASDVYAGISAIWDDLWEDDLIMTGVRSFDVKAYDDLYGGYVDLGWANDARISGSTDFLLETPATATSPLAGGPTMPSLATFAHEGRMPPLTTDNRYDAQFGAATYLLPTGNTYTGNIGDDSTRINRLRRVFDTWSTDYTMAPAHAVNPMDGTPIGPPHYPPVYPSYPPPYPAPLKGIQIQIRVVDPANQHVKQMTIRHDFTDKL